MGGSRVETGIDGVSCGRFSLSDGGERAHWGLYNTPQDAPDDATIPPAGQGAGAATQDVPNETNLTPLSPPHHKL